MIRRVLVLGGFAAVLLLLSMFSANTPDLKSAPAQVGLINRSEEGSTWFCAAAGASASDPTTHQILISNSSARSFEATVTVYRSQTDASVAQSITVDPLRQTTLSATDLAADGAGVTVEIFGEGGSVAHRLTASSSFDEAPCATDGAKEWHFPAADTLRGRSARLWLLNPFGTDASVDVRVSTADSVRVPKGLNGIVVPARSGRMVELGEIIQRRDQFAFTAISRSGLVIAELAESADGTATEGSPEAIGLRLDPGRPNTQKSWLFADGFAGEGVTDRVMVFNPGSADSVVQVSVVPAGLSQEELPEPFELTVAGRRYGSISLEQETRLPPGGLRWTRVDVLSGSGVVVAHIQGITKEGGNGDPTLRPIGSGGLSSSAGVSTLASRWVFPAVAAGADGQALVIIANPDPDTIAIVSVVELVDGNEVEVISKQEVAANSTLVVPRSESSDTSVSMVLTSTSPVAAEARTSSKSRDDFTVYPGFPDANTLSSL